MDREERPCRRLPEDLAGQVQSCHPKGMTVEKRHEDTLAIAGWRGGCVSVGRIDRHPPALMDVRLPKQRSRRAIIAERHLNAGRLIGTGQEHSLAPDNRAGVSTSRDWRFPDDVLGLAPASWGVGIQTDTVRLRATPPRPAIRRHRARSHGHSGARLFRANRLDGRGAKTCSLLRLRWITKAVVFLRKASSATADAGDPGDDQEDRPATPTPSWQAHNHVFDTNAALVIDCALLQRSRHSSGSALRRAAWSGHTWAVQKDMQSNLARARQAFQASPTVSTSCRKSGSLRNGSKSGSAAMS